MLKLKEIGSCTFIKIYRKEEKYAKVLTVMVFHGFS